MVSSSDATPRSVGEASTPMPAMIITLVSMDGDSFEVEASAIELSQLIKAMVDGVCRSNMSKTIRGTLLTFQENYSRLVEYPSADDLVHGDQVIARLTGRSFVEWGAGAHVSSSADDAREIPLPNMRSNVLAKVVEFCKHHKAEPMKKIPKPIRHGLDVEDHVQEWYIEFLRSLDDGMLFELLLGANYLDITPLLEICAAKIGLRIMNKTPDEVRREFNITEEFSPEVERKLRDENKWSTEPPVAR